MRNKTKQMIYAALLIALAIIIPVIFSGIKIIIGPFTATPASHLPMFVAMMISPMVAIVVGIGSTIGFLLTGTIMPVVFRAATHILVGYVGALIIKKKKNYKLATIVTAPIHGIAEALVVIPFVGFDLYYLIVITCIGTIAHHFFDSVLSYAVIKGVSRARRCNIYDTFGEFNNTAEI